MKADYQLRHQLLGKIGSFWSLQVDDVTKRRVRSLVTTASSSGELQRLDVVAGTAAGVRSVIVSDVSFDFMDGDFVYVGRDFEAYSRFEAGGLTFVRRDIAAGVAPAVHEHKLASVSSEFVAVASGEFDGSFDCYLVPIPHNLSPIVISSRLPGVFLVAGIDFTCHEGYIAMRDNPAEVLPIGPVTVTTAEMLIGSHNSYPLAAPEVRSGNRRIVDFYRKTQSIRAFRLAAAQYCGLYVFDHADRVLYAKADGAAMTYILANAGVVSISYPHYKLSVGQNVPAGHVVSLRFDFLEYREHGPGYLTEAAQHNGAAVSLNFISPVKGIFWSVQEPVLADYVETGYGGRPHARLHLTAHPESLQEFWDTQKRHELATGQYLSDVLGLTAQNPEVENVDMGQLLESFYGDRLTLIVANELPAEMQRRLQDFLMEHRPTGCALLYSVIPAIFTSPDDESVYLGQFAYDGSGFIYNVEPLGYT